MKKLRRRFDRFCFQHREQGIPNLMLYICLGSALVYVMSLADRSGALYLALCFDRTAILHGQIWRLITYPLTFHAGGVLMTLLCLLCYYSIGRAMENIWGTFRFNLFYFTGIVMMDVFCLIFGGRADVYYLNMGLFLSYATLFPDSMFLLFFIVPIRAWVFALFDLILVVVGLFTDPFPVNLFPVVALLNYFLFFGKDVLDLVPLSWQANARRLFRRKNKQPKVVPFPSAGSYQSSAATVKAPYTHRCTVCGRTDVTNPELEFRYCSKCKGYYCYCEEHISSHAHIP